jgi:membrane protease YdiL (CAAX protease family)
VRPELRTNALALVRRYPLASYLIAVYGLSWGGFVFLALCRRVRDETVGSLDALLLFPFCVVGVGIVGVVMTRLLDGREGLRRLRSRVAGWRVGWGWYAVALAMPPCTVVAVLSLLRAVVAPEFAPNRFVFGLLFGLLPGFAEEIGWTGFALPRLLSRGSAAGAAVALGILWGLWHLPVVDFLGAASPHGRSWLPFLGAFTFVLVAMRVLMVWVYGKTGSVLLAQLMHASSTGSLVVFGPPRISPAQEATWYGLYGAALWIVVLILIAIEGTDLGLSAKPRP